ncbi:VWA domain-containing protein, partial [Desulfobulbus sp. TB]|nr:VWA domain-containing protein [Desulfobulbus sp. TB]
MKKFLLLSVGMAFFAYAITSQAGGIDVVIGIDESGSMSSAINNVKTNVGAIYNALPEGSRVGLVGYGTSSHCGGGSQVPHIHTSITTDRNVFHDSVDDMVASGSKEQGYRLVYEIATDTIANGWDSISDQCNGNQSLSFTGTQHCQIVITDDRLDQGGRTQQEAIKALQDNGGIFFGILKNKYASYGHPLAAAVKGGKIFDFDAFINDPTNVINDVLTACMKAIDPLNFVADDGHDVNDPAQCIPANTTDITYTLSYENTNLDTVEGVEINHTGGTWGGSSWNWLVGDVLASATDSNTMVFTFPVQSLTPDTIISNEFTVTTTTPNVPDVTISDNVKVCRNTQPKAQCQQNVTLSLDSSGRAVLPPPLVDNGSSDLDGDPLTYSLSKTNFTCADIGTQHAVTLKVTDDGGLSDTCVSKVTVVDNLSPVPNAASLPQITGQCSATIPAAPTATDNCAGTVTGTTTDPLSYSAQGTYTVTWTFDDGNGNTVTQTQQVVVQDTIAPTVITKNITVSLNSEGNASIIADAIDNGSTDNCCLSSKSISKSNFTCADVGQNTVTLTVTDCNGNSSSAPATVTVEDNIPPVVLTQDVVAHLDDTCNASITADDINAGSSDACGIASLSVDQDSFTCSDIGENTVTLT